MGHRDVTQVKPRVHRAVVAPSHAERFSRGVSGRFTEAKRSPRERRPAGGYHDRMQNEHESEGRLVTGLAATGADVRAAQQLRYLVFHDELGARLPHAESRLDRDRFDTWCDHLIVRDGQDGPVVGTYRMLPGQAARRLGSFYSEHEFELGAVRDLPELVEVGRACVHPAYRSGAVITLLWAGLARYLHATGARYVMGCASIPIGARPRTARAALVNRTRPTLGGPATSRTSDSSPAPANIQADAARPAGDVGRA